jgi:hypothetical protein
MIAKLMHGGKGDFDADAQREEEARNRAIEEVIQKKESMICNDDQNPDKSFVAIPIISTDRTCLGALMMQWKRSRQGFTIDDQKMLESYNAFFSLSLERSKLQEIAQLGQMEVETQALMTPEQRKASAVPEKLLMSEEEREVILTIGFDSANYQSFGLIKVVCNLFDMFELNQTFNIQAQALFAFLYELRQAYNTVPYHNWNHAVESTQFLAYELHYAELGSVFTPFEILIMLTACICHDAGHDGFQTTFNAQADVPLGILFPDRSVLETQHCTIAIELLTRTVSDIFQALSSEECERLWPMFIMLIMSTDMSKHFDLLDQLQDLWESRRKWEADEKDRFLMMQILVKSADLSTPARNFQIADKHPAAVCEEFFRQGVLDRVPDLRYHGEVRDRDHLDKKNSQLIFYEKVCLPLFEVLGRVIPLLGTLPQHVKANVRKWEEIRAQNQQLGIEEEEEEYAEEYEEEEDEYEDVVETSRTEDST